MIINVKGIDDIKVLEKKEIEGVFYKEVYIRADKIDVSVCMGTGFITMERADMLIGNISIDEIKSIEYKNKGVYIKTS